MPRTATGSRTADGGRAHSHDRRPFTAVHLNVLKLREITQRDSAAAARPGEVRYGPRI